MLPSFHKPAKQPLTDARKALHTTEMPRMRAAASAAPQRTIALQGRLLVAAEALQHDEGAGGSCTATERSHDSALDSSSAAQSASGGDVHAAGQQQTSTSLQEAAGPDRLPGDSSADLPRSGSSGACTVDEVRTAAGAGPAQEGGRGLPGLDWQLLRGLLRDNGFPDLPEQVRTAVGQ